MKTSYENISRQEPVVYVNGKPFTARDPAKWVSREGGICRVAQSSSDQSLE